MRATGQRSLLSPILLILAIFVAHAASKAVAVPGVVDIPPLPPAPNPAARSEPYNAYQDAKRWYSGHPYRQHHYGNHYKTIVITRTICERCQTPVTIYTTTSWCPTYYSQTPYYYQTPWHSTSHYYYGGGGGYTHKHYHSPYRTPYHTPYRTHYHSPTRVRTVYRDHTTTVDVAVTSPATPQGICSTIFAKGKGLPVTTQGSCGLIVIKNAASRSTHGERYTLAAWLSAGFAVVAASGMVLM